MSWDAYVDNIIQQTTDGSGQKHCDKAAIIGLDGGALWTSGTGLNGLNISPQEGCTIANCFKSGNFTSMQASGIYVGGVKYQFLRQEENAVMGRSKGLGITLQRTRTAIVCAHCAEGKQQGTVNKGVDVVAKYLESNNM